jgi:3-oxoadipate enol-lactonase
MTKSVFVLEGKVGAPVLLVANSLAANYTMWEPQIAEWKKHFQVLRYNYRGHGGTESLGDFATSQDLADDVNELLDSLNISSVHWVGLSLGAMLGIYFAAHYPQKVKALAAACFKPNQSPESYAMWEGRINTVKEKGMAAIVDATADRWLTEGFRQANPAIDQSLRTMIAGNEDAGYMACGHAVKDYDLRPYIGRVSCPVLLIGGQFDGGAPAAAISDLRSVLAHSEYAELPGAHIANQECAPEFTALVSNFMANHI